MVGILLLPPLDPDWSGIAEASSLPIRMSTTQSGFRILAVSAINVPAKQNDICIGISGRLGELGESPMKSAKSERRVLVVRQNDGVSLFP